MRRKNPVTGAVCRLPGVAPVLKNLLIESQRVNDVLVFDARERFGKYVGELFVCRNVFDVKRASFIMISDEVIPDVDMLRALIIGFVFDDRFCGDIVGEEDRERRSEFDGNGLEEGEMSEQFARRVG